MSSRDEPVRSCVLHVSITHLIYPVTEKVLGQIFDVYGVNDVCLLQQPTHLDVFVEFQSWHEASQARAALHGRCIYDGCCLLDIQHAAPSISVHRLPNSEPVVVDWDRVEVEPIACSSTPSSSTSAPAAATTASMAICKISTEVHTDTACPVVVKALDNEEVVALPAAPHETSSAATTKGKDAREDVFPAAAGCGATTPTSSSTLGLHDNSDKHITSQVPVCAPTACPNPSPDRSLCTSGVPRPRPWPSFLPDGDGERLTSSWPATQGIWPYLQLKTPWLYSAQALLSKGPRWFQQFGFHKFSSVCKAAYQWDPGILVGIFHVHSVGTLKLVMVHQWYFQKVQVIDYLVLGVKEWVQDIQCVQPSSVVSCAPTVCRQQHIAGTTLQVLVDASVLELQARDCCRMKLLAGSLKHMPAIVLWICSRNKPLIGKCCITFICGNHWVHELLVKWGFRSSDKMQVEQLVCSSGESVEVQCFIFYPRIMSELVQCTSINVLEFFPCNIFLIMEMNNLDIVELSYYIPGLHMFIGISITRMIWSVACLLNYHGEVVHTDCQMIKKSKYKMEEQPKHGGTGLHSFFPHLVWLSNNILMAALEKGIALVPVVICVEVLDTHAQWDPGGFLLTMGGENKTDHLERSLRLQRVGAHGYRSIIGLNDSPAPWDPGIVAIYESVVPARVKVRRTPCRSGSCELLQPVHAIAWGQAMFCRGGSVTPDISPGPHLVMGC